MANRKTIIALGALATFGALMGILADVLSAWSPHANQMATAFSVKLENIAGLYEEKPRWSYIAGNYIGLYFIPFHIFGFLLIFQALRPASVIWSRVFLVSAIYLTSIGVALHGSLAFVGDIFRSRDADLIRGMQDYWQLWAYSVVIGYAMVSVLILCLILTGRSLYPWWTSIISPIGIVAISAVAIAVLPENLSGLKTFLALTGLNLPLAILFPITAWILARRGVLSLSL